MLGHYAWSAQVEHGSRVIDVPAVLGLVHEAANPTLRATHRPIDGRDRQMLPAVGVRRVVDGLGGRGRSRWYPIIGSDAGGNFALLKCLVRLRKRCLAKPVEVEGSLSLLARPSFRITPNMQGQSDERSTIEGGSPSLGRSIKRPGVHVVHQHQIALLQRRPDCSQFRIEYCDRCAGCRERTCLSRSSWRRDARRRRLEPWT